MDQTPGLAENPDLSAYLDLDQIATHGLAGKAPEIADDPDFYAYDDALDPYTNFILKYRTRPKLFCQEVLGFEAQDWQAELMTEVLNGTRQIAIRAGHGVGKSSGVAVLCIWMLVVGNAGDLKIIVSAPTQTTMRDGIYAEILKWFKKAPQAIQDLYEFQAERIYLKASPATVFLAARVSGINTPEALAGIHAERVLIVVDEASGVPNAVFETARGSMSSVGAQTILISNPTRNSGTFYECFHSMSANWKLMHVSCAGNPRVAPEFRAEFIFGEDDPQYQIRYLGNFPTGDSDTLIAAELVDSAVIRDIAVDSNADLVYGLDVARHGPDESVLCRRKGNVVLDFTVWKGLDTMELVGRVAAMARTDSPVSICVDSIGIGAGVADRLREMNFPVRDVNVAESAAMNENCSRLRDELWVAVRDFLNTRACRIPDDKKLRQDLVSPKLEYLSNGKMKVESKDSLRRRTKSSPDRADSLCLTFAATAAGVGGRYSKWGNGPLKRNLRAVI